MRSEGEVNHAVEEYADMIKRVCFYYLKNHADTEDIFQKVFLKYMMHEEMYKLFCCLFQPVICLNAVKRVMNFISQFRHLPVFPEN